MYKAQTVNDPLINLAYMFCKTVPMISTTHVSEVKNCHLLQIIHSASWMPFSYLSINIWASTQDLGPSIHGLVTDIQVNLQLGMHCLSRHSQYYKVFETPQNWPNTMCHNFCIPGTVLNGSVSEKKNTKVIR